MERVPYCQCQNPEPRNGALATGESTMRCIKTGASAFYDAGKTREADRHVDVFECDVCHARVAI
jgi:hypothetical protein